MRFYRADRLRRTSRKLILWACCTGCLMSNHWFEAMSQQASPNQSGNCTILVRTETAYRVADYYGRRDRRDLGELMEELGYVPIEHNTYGLIEFFHRESGSSIVLEVLEYHPISHREVEELTDAIVGMQDYLHPLTPSGFRP